jgi:murein DD-endopeptidase MepM/ murein hydrolase activator NlpD/uncharacterized protein YraI
MEAFHTDFIVSRHGAPFSNQQMEGLPLAYPLPGIGAVNLAEFSPGLSGGICMTALDFFHAGEEFPAAGADGRPDPQILSILRQRQLDSLKLPMILKGIEYWFEEPRRISRRLLRIELPKIIHRLHRGKPTLLFILEDSPEEIRGRFVVATGASQRPDQGWDLSLYDPVKPGLPVTLQVNTPTIGQQNILVRSDNGSIRAFFVVPYRLEKLAVLRAHPRRGISFGPEAAGEAPLFRLNWPVDSRRVNQLFGENPDTYRPFKLAGHEGLDLFALSGANIYAAADGEVTQAEFPKNHPYGLHVRIRHETGGQGYQTIYAHLSEVKVKPGQRVRAGELIGLADNSGNSFGSHLHLTLKIDGKKTAGYPAGIVDPWPYLKEGADVPPTSQKPLPDPSGLAVFTTGEVNLRAGPGTNFASAGLIPAGEQVMTLGDLAAVRAKIGQQGQWLPVQTAAGKKGYVAAWFMQDKAHVFPPSGLVVYPTSELNLRAGPATSFPTTASLGQDDPLSVLGDERLSRGKIGKEGEWIQVRTEAGVTGFVAAWLVHITGQTPAASGLVVYSTEKINIRARPELNAHLLTVIQSGEGLNILGEPGEALAKVGKDGQWLHVRTRGGFTGFAAAWLLCIEKPERQGESTISGDLIVFAAEDINLRAQPSPNSPRVGGASRGERLTVLETDPDVARSKIGQQNSWVFVQRVNAEQGWAAAWFLSLKSG